MLSVSMIDYQDAKSYAGNRGLPIIGQGWNRLIPVQLALIVLKSVWDVHTGGRDPGVEIGMTPFQ